MPNNKDIFDENKIGQFYKTQSGFGKSRVSLIPLNNSDTNIKIAKKEIWLPSLDIEKYYSGAKKYILVEEFFDDSLIMVDVLYSYTDFSNIFNGRKEEFDRFVTSIDRNNITNNNFIGLMFFPEDRINKRKFILAIRDSLLKESTLDKFPSFSNQKIEEHSVIDESYKTEKKDGLASEMMKDIYESISGKVIRRPGEPRTKKVQEIINRKIKLFKSGSIIVNGSLSNKYGIAYSSDDKKSKGFASIYLNDIDDYEIFSLHDISRLKKLEVALFDIETIEKCLSNDTYDLNKYTFDGKYNEKKGVFEYDKLMMTYFSKINDIVNEKENNWR